ncbi:hypothetical protein [Oryzibacter oryziterrae]|uniref:hypothetical protein n=1 Tax=Oryzibacter oryziterrae TaxID=2766474 RepID=UPI001F3DED8C|nr:hypothetical protein [Oryzibacter oryziterrae]
MFRLFDICLVVVCALCIFSSGISPSAAVTNLTVNGGVETPALAVSSCPYVTGKLAVGWNDNSCWMTPSPHVRYALDTRSRHGGAAAQSVTLLSGAGAQLIQTLPRPTTTRQLMQVRLWLRSSSHQTVTVQIRQTDSPYAVYGQVEVTATAAWRAFTFPALASKGSTSLVLFSNDRGTFSFDDVQVVGAGTAPLLPKPPSQPVPSRYFGTHFNYLDTPWPASAPHFGSIRIWDGDRSSDGSGVGAQWADVSPAEGVFHWSGLDQRVASATAHGADVIYTLGGRTPRWASARPDAPSPYGPGQCALPKSDSVWRAWIQALASRYKGKIRYWEIWNEPNYAEFFCGDLRRMVALTAIARQTIRSIDPQARIVSPSYNGVEGLSGLTQFLDAGGGSLVDVIGYHFYVDRPEDMRRSATLVRAAMASHGLTRLPIWNTEQGWYDGVLPVDLMDSGTASAYVARSMLLNWLWGLSRFHYYTWDNNNRIVFTAADHKTLVAAGKAYAFVMRTMSGATMTAASETGSLVHVTLARGRQVTHVLWSTAGSMTRHVPQDWRATTVTDVQGSSKALTGTQVVVGPSPVFVH